MPIVSTTTEPVQSPRAVIDVVAGSKIHLQAPVPRVLERHHAIWGDRGTVGADREPGGFFFKRDYKLTCDLTDSVTGDESSGAR